jgi:prepilin-type N-terminal cleavage/methylation domain-containing protein
MPALRSWVLGLESRVCRSAARRKGMSLVEVLIVLTIVGTLMAIAIPHSLLMLDRISVHSAAGDLAMTLSSARDFALSSHSSVAVDLAGPHGEVRVMRGSDVLFMRNIASAHGVQLTHSRDSLTFGPLGLGRGAANLSIVVRRRAAVETVFVSRLGRIR